MSSHSVLLCSHPSKVRPKSWTTPTKQIPNPNMHNCIGNSARKAISGRVAKECLLQYKNIIISFWISNNSVIPSSRNPPHRSTGERANQKRKKIIIKEASERKAGVRNRQTHRLAKPIIFSRPGLKPWGVLAAAVYHPSSHQQKKTAYLEVSWSRCSALR